MVVELAADATVGGGSGCQVLVAVLGLAAITVVVGLRSLGLVGEGGGAGGVPYILVGAGVAAYDSGIEGE